MLVAVDGVAVHRGAEGGVDLAGGAAEVDAGAGGVDLNAGEAVGGEPDGDEGDVAVGGAVGGTEGLGGEPLVEGGGGLVLLLIEELLEGGLLLGAALEEQNDVVQGRAVVESSLVELGTGKRVDVTGESGDAGVVDGLEDAGAWRRLGLRCNDRQEKNKGRQNRQLGEPGHWIHSCCLYRQKISFRRGIETVNNRLDCVLLMGEGQGKKLQSYNTYGGLIFRNRTARAWTSPCGCDMEKAAPCGCGLGIIGLTSSMER